MAGSHASGKHSLDMRPEGAAGDSHQTQILWNVCKAQKDGPKRTVYWVSAIRLTGLDDLDDLDDIERSQGFVIIHVRVLLLDKL